MDLVWLKRDARLADHEPMAMAASGGRQFMILYMYEPDQLSHATVHGSHIAFINEGLQELDGRLKKLSGRAEHCITTRRGEATEILSNLHAAHKIARLLSHEESGHNASYARDLRVKAWCARNNVDWIEVPQSCVLRGLSLRDSSWREMCEIQVESFLSIAPKESPFGSVANAKTILRALLSGQTEGFLSASQLGLPVTIACDRAERQRGGESKALDLLSSFLNSRGERYAGGGVISSPNSAWTQCSRLSTYYSWGHISIRTVVHAVNAKRASAKGRWAQSLEAYMTRLQWRRTRIQDFEMRCWMEHKSVCRSWEHLLKGNTFIFGDPALLGKSTEQERIAAFEKGKTGYPMVDACMRCLLHTGWLNFRMRCMLASFATYNLWLHWRAVSDHLARCFLDYEPGIHYVQLQLHAGTFGGMLHCYNVTKQAKDHDPDGVFIRKYVPELADVPNTFVHEPWKMPARPSARTNGRRWTTRYPMPIVDDRRTAEASRKVIEAAHQKLYAQQDSHPETDEDDELQMALKASVAKEGTDGSEDARRETLDAIPISFMDEEAELQRAIELSLAGA
eukprot:TRINITY_DN11003_c0_g2_i3.p1 TRINITY_DN11003_c0_g2~~TRINITY_DN11003_c0_g2_i3.p1  ORF type:complete len:567 (+),score=35.94 TRINITY_DN11003_c0_g2_i3:42-1742(+)